MNKRRLWVCADALACGMAIGLAIRYQASDGAFSLFMAFIAGWMAAWLLVEVTRIIAEGK